MVGGSPNSVALTELQLENSVSSFQPIISVQSKLTELFFVELAEFLLRRACRVCPTTPRVPSSETVFHPLPGSLDLDSLGIAKEKRPKKFPKLFFAGLWSAANGV